MMLVEEFSMRLILLSSRKRTMARRMTSCKSERAWSLDSRMWSSPYKPKSAIHGANPKILTHEWSWSIFAYGKWRKLWEKESNLGPIQTPYHTILRFKRKFITINYIFLILGFTKFWLKYQKKFRLILYWCHFDSMPLP